MADIERALGRPERALELAGGPEAQELGRAETIELAIVAAGARRDLGELDAAVVGLQIPELDAARREPWSGRLFYAYADNLLTVGRASEALQWFVHAADVDEDGETDAARRIAELTGEPFADDDEHITFGMEDTDVAGAAVQPMEPEATEPEAAESEATESEATESESAEPDGATQPEAMNPEGADSADDADEPEAVADRSPTEDDLSGSAVSPQPEKSGS